MNKWYKKRVNFVLNERHSAVQSNNVLQKPVARKKRYGSGLNRSFIYQLMHKRVALKEY
jgi:hypothetical protein